MNRMVERAGTRLCFRLSAAQLDLLRPGIGRIFACYQQWERDGESKNSYPFRLCPDPRRAPGKLNTVLMKEVLDLWKILFPKFGRKRPRLRLTYIQIAAAILAVRIGQDEMRRGKAKPWSHREKRTARRLLEKLELLRRQARRRYIADSGKHKYERLANRWRKLLRWIRMNLVYFRPWPAISKGGKLRRQIVDDAVSAAQQRLRFLEWQLPESVLLRKLTRGFLRLVRRGRAPGRVRDFAHPHSHTVVAMVEYIMKRCRLKRQRTESRPAMKIGQKTSHATGASADATMCSRAARAETTSAKVFVPKTRRFSKDRLRSLKQRWKKLTKKQRTAAVEAWLRTGAGRRELARHLKCSEGQIRWLLLPRKPTASADLGVTEQFKPEQDSPTETTAQMAPPIAVVSPAKELAISVKEGVQLFLGWLDDQGGAGFYTRGLFSEVRMKLDAKEYHNALRPGTYRLPPVVADGYDLGKIIESCRPPGNPDDTSWTDYHATWAVEWLLRVCSDSGDREAIVEEAERNAITPAIARMTW
jgi:hypothetical protein